MCKADGENIRGVGPSETIGQGSTADEEETMAAEYAMPYNPPIDYIESLSRFEQVVLGRLDNIARDQRRHHVAKFQLLHNDIESVQEQIDILMSH